MKKIILIITIIFVFSSKGISGVATWRNINQLDDNHRLMYTMGVIDGMSVTEAFHETLDKRFNPVLSKKINRQITTDTLLSIIDDYSRTHQEKWDLPAEVFILNALNSVFDFK